MLPSAMMSRAAPKTDQNVGAKIAVSGGGNSTAATPTESTSQDPSSLSFNVVTINVGGLRYQTYSETLEKYPDTLLGDPVRRKTFFNKVRQTAIIWFARDPKATKEYFFDRHRSAFEGIQYFYQSSGRLRRPETVPIDIFVNELRFFGLSRSIIDNFLIAEGYCRKFKMHRLEKNSCRSVVWRFLEYPDSSICARLFAFISILVILLSIVSFCLETVPKFKRAYAKFDNETSSINTTSGRQSLLELEIIGIDWSNPFSVIDFVCICWFSGEFVLRLIFCPNKWKFSTNLLNIIDLVAIVPFYINLLLENESWLSLIVLRIVRLVRVFRVFKLSRYSNGLRILGKTIKASLEELFLLLFFMMIALIIFSTAIYCVENRKNFESIPEAFWFTIATMTTVGYGDLTPKEPLGKLVGGLCAILGVLILALPAPVIVANFKCYYDQQKRLSLMHSETEDSKDQESTSKSG